MHDEIAIRFYGCAMASALQRPEIGHDILDLACIELEPRHDRMDTIRQGPLQIRNRISETQRAKRRRDREWACANLVDGMTLGAIQADKSRPASFRRRLSHGGVDGS